MRDKIIDFIEQHRILSWILIILFVVIIVLLLKGCGKEEEVHEPIEEVVSVPTLAPTEAPTEVPTEVPKATYNPNLGLVEDDGRVVIPDATPTPIPTEVPQIKPMIEPFVRVYDNTSVPEKTMDNRSFKKYLKNAKLKDFGTFWGKDLTENDFIGNAEYMVGVEQEKGYERLGDLQSVGWLHNNLPFLNENDAIRFTNLHVIGSLSDNHVALLCAYDWYSAYGLEDVLVVFEDISGTLSTDTFNEGDIFSAVVFVHNVKSIEVNDERVLCVQYQTFK